MWNNRAHAHLDWVKGAPNVGAPYLVQQDKEGKKQMGCTPHLILREKGEQMGCSSHLIFFAKRDRERKGESKVLIGMGFDLVKVLSQIEVLWFYINP